MRAVLTCVVVFAVGCGGDPVAKPTEKAAEPAVAKPKPPTKKPAPQKPVAAIPEGVTDPQQPKPKTFDEAWAEAVKTVEAWEREEPERTAKALKILTPSESAQARLYMNIGSRNGLHVPVDQVDTVATALCNLGLHEFVFCTGSKSARESDSFKAIVRVFYSHDTTSAELARSMRMWGCVVNREIVRDTVVENRPVPDLVPGVRDGILMLGGRKWLESR